MTSLHVRTPLIESDVLGAIVGVRVWLKMEALQPSGSFKNRGMGAACRRAVEQGAKKIISSSGGNAGLAVAYAGRRLGVPGTIVVPKSTGERARELIAAQGAKVRIHGAAWDDSHRLGLELSRHEHGAYVHPFDDPVVWDGHASMIDEVIDAGLKPDLVIVSVGGGGLFCGLMQGLDRNGLGHIRILALETEGAASLHRSLVAHHLIELEQIDTIATTLGARRVAPAAFDFARRPNVATRTVTDSQALDSCFRFATDHRVLVEPACGAALAAVYGHFQPVPECHDILLIVCGGAGVNIDMLETWRREFSDT